ncbi:MAG: hypothetical protein F4103_04240, partial [Boseongicola sp. SB0673_bin_14]|nr:hypothetical protein [Boseongicola sp. SB0673_bin_14]
MRLPHARPPVPGQAPLGAGGRRGAGVGPRRRPRATLRAHRERRARGPGREERRAGRGRSGPPAGFRAGGRAGGGCWLVGRRAVRCLGLQRRAGGLPRSGLVPGRLARRGPWPRRARDRRPAAPLDTARRRRGSGHRLAGAGGPCGRIRRGTHAVSPQFRSCAAPGCRSGDTGNRPQSALKRIASRLAFALALVAGAACLAEPAAAQADTTPPKLVANNKISVTSTGPYGVGDVIEITATFNETVVVTTSGNPVNKPSIDVVIGKQSNHLDWRSAVYHSGSGSTALAFRYTVVKGDKDDDGIQVVGGGVKLGFGGAKIADEAGNEARTEDLNGPQLGPLGGHKVDGVRPTVTGVSVHGTTLTITFDETLGAAANLANSAFTVKKTPAGGNPQTVSLSGSPSISGDTVTLTLATAVVATDTGVKVSYTAPTTGTDNTIRDAAGNDVANFSDKVASTNPAPRFPENAPTEIDVAENTAPGTAVVTVAASDPDGDTLTYSLTSPGGGHRSFAIDGDGRITVAAGATLNHEGQTRYTIDVQVRDNKDAGGTPDTSVDATHRVNINVTDVDEPPVAPTGVTVTGASSTSVRVTWTAPDGTGKPATTGYDIRWFQGNADPGQDSDWTEHAHSGIATSTTIGQLNLGSTYRVQVRAKNHEGTSPWSDSGSGSPKAVVPSGCSTDSLVQDWIASVTSTSSSITVTLNAPPRQGGIDLLICQPSGDEQVVFTSGQPSAGSYTITNLGTGNTGSPLEPDTDYWVRVSNPGVGNNSVWRYIRTKKGPPAVNSVALVSTPTVDADGNGTNDTYKPGDTVRAQVTFDQAVDVTGSPVLKLKLAGNSSERTMAFDTSRSRTNTTTLEFTYT